MDKDFDSGDILSQSIVKIEQSDDANILYKKICEVALKQIEEFVPKLITGNFLKTKQNKSLANFWRKRNFSDGQIDWRMSADSIYNLVRGLSRPYVGAHFSFSNDYVKVWSSKIEMNVPKNVEPGKVLDINKEKILVKAGINGLWLNEISPKIVIKPGMYL